MAAERDDSELNIPDVLAILPLRGTVIFPQAVMPLAVGRPASVRLIQEALQGSRIIGAVMQRDPSEDAPRAQGLHTIGTATVIEKALKQPDGTLRLVVQGLGRFRITDVVQEMPFLRARIQRLTDEAPSATLEVEALARTASGLFQKVVALSPTLPDELANVLGAAEGPGALADLIAGSLPTLPTALRQELLETIGVAERLQRLVAALTKEAEVLELGSKIQSEVQSEMSKTQREYYLREQMKAIQKELGDADDRTQEIDTLRRKIETAGMTEEASKEALRELDRLAKMPPAAAEYTVARTYIDWLVSMPCRVRVDRWSESSSRIGFVLLMWMRILRGPAIASSTSIIPPGPDCGRWPMAAAFFFEKPSWIISSMLQKVPSSSRHDTPRSTSSKPSGQRASDGAYTAAAPVAVSSSRYATVQGPGCSSAAA